VATTETEEITEEIIDDTQVTEGIEQDTEGEASLGDAGKKALDAMKAQRNAATKDAREYKAELARLREEAALKSKPAEEQALEQARSEARAEATKTANTRILRSELRAAAKGKLADPADAALYINLDDFDVNEDGEVDSAALDDAIDELIARKTHLAVANLRKFEGAGDQGAKREVKASQLSAKDIESMTPAEVNAARRAGRLDKALGVN